MGFFDVVGIFFSCWFGVLSFGFGSDNWGRYCIVGFVVMYDVVVCFVGFRFL